MLIGSPNKHPVFVLTPNSSNILPSSRTTSRLSSKQNLEPQRIGGLGRERDWMRGGEGGGRTQVSTHMGNTSLSPQPSLSPCSCPLDPYQEARLSLTSHPYTGALTSPSHSSRVPSIATEPATRPGISA